MPHVRCGKLIVAPVGSAHEHSGDAGLARVKATADAAGARVELVDDAFVAIREPHIARSRGLWSPDTGWVDADAYVRALETDVRRHEGVVLPGTEVVGVEPTSGDGLVVVTSRERIDAAAVVNAAGSTPTRSRRARAASRFGFIRAAANTRSSPRASADSSTGSSIRCPIPSGHGLGVHLTKTLSGAVWLGPTIRYQDDKTDYEHDWLPLSTFLESARVLLPSLGIDDLRLAGSGIRAKLHPPSERFADFLIRRDARVPALFHAAGIDSPGLTASLAIGRLVADQVEGR